LRQQLIKRIAGYAARNVWIAPTNLFRVFVTDAFQSGIDFSAPAALLDNALQFGFTRGANTHSQAVVRQDLEFFNVLERSAAHKRVNTTRIVTDHAAKSAVVVCCRIGRERQVMLVRGIAEIIQDETRLYSRNASFGIEFHDVVHVLRHVEHESNIATLTCQARAAAAREDGRAEAAGNR